MRENENDLGNINKAEVQRLDLGGTPKFRSLLVQKEAAKEPAKQCPGR